jgi:hypothetical protein
MTISTTWTAFEGERLLLSGAPPDVALAVKAALAKHPERPVLTFDDRSGRAVDLDLRGSDEDIAARVSPSAEEAPPKSAGRPKLGVVAREVTLLPRHWEWLAAQPGGASVVLRKLVDAARTASGDDGRIRQAQEAADKFMSAMLGDRPGYEDAARALYAGDAIRFRDLSAAWPDDLAGYARRLAAPILER